MFVLQVQVPGQELRMVTDEDGARAGRRGAEARGLCSAHGWYSAATLGGNAGVLTDLEGVAKVDRRVASRGVKPSVCRGPVLVGAAQAFVAEGRARGLPCAGSRGRRTSAGMAALHSMRRAVRGESGEVTGRRGSGLMRAGVGQVWFRLSRCRMVASTLP